MSTESGKPLNGTPEPFRRPVVWGRPPATVFRVGPLPTDQNLSPLPKAPPAASRPTPGAGIFSGSMIPRAAPRPAPGMVTTAPSEPVPVAEVPVAAAPSPDLTVRPLPTVEPAAARPGPAPQTAPSAGASRPVDAEPAVVGATLRSASARGKASGRTVLYGGIAVAGIAVIAAAGWMLTRAPATAPAPAVVEAPVLAPVPVAAVPAPLVVAEPSAIETPVTTAPRPAPTPAATSAAPAPRPAEASGAARPTAATPVRPAPTPAPTTGETSPPAIAAPPVVVIAPAPPAGSPPTAAERPSVDPDAPIATRPQPVG